jgi:hypothetical protein
MNVTALDAYPLHVGCLLRSGDHVLITVRVVHILQPSLAPFGRDISPCRLELKHSPAPVGTDISPNFARQAFILSYSKDANIMPQAFGQSKRKQHKCEIVSFIKQKVATDQAPVALSTTHDREDVSFVKHLSEPLLVRLLKHEQSLCHCPLKQASFVALSASPCLDRGCPHKSDIPAILLEPHGLPHNTPLV